MTNLTVLFIYLLLLILPFFLQIYLSKRENPFLGLVLPILCVLFSVMIVLGSYMYNGEALSVVAPMILFNIPTVIHLTIYAACRESVRKNARKNSEMDKSNILDL